MSENYLHDLKLSSGGMDCDYLLELRIKAVLTIYRYFIKAGEKQKWQKE